MAQKSVRDLLRVTPGGDAVVLAGYDARATPGVASRKRAEREIADDGAALAGLQERLWAEERRAVLVVLQGTDTSGKDGVIKHVFDAVNPAGLTVTSFKVPTEAERRHHYLWRIKRALPRPGFIGIFNRSHYEDVIVVRVKELVPQQVWEKRYDEINRWEATLAKSDITVVKCFLHISFDEQRERLLARLDDPEKRWKFNPADLDERARWAEYVLAYEAALSRCSTEAAPWYVVPADRKWYRNWAIGKLLLETLDDLAPEYPRPDLDIPALRDTLTTN